MKVPSALPEKENKLYASAAQSLTSEKFGEGAVTRASMTSLHIIITLPTCIQAWKSTIYFDKEVYHKASIVAYHWLF